MAEPCGQDLRLLEMDKSGHSCDVCEDKIQMGEKIMRYKRCDYDVCEKCQQARV